MMQNLCLQLSTSNESDATLTASVACHNADIGQDTLRWTEDPNVMLCGITSSLSISRDQPNHSFAVCFLLPGLYKMYIFDAIAQAKQLLPPLDHSIRPAYFLVD